MDVFSQIISTLACLPDWLSLLLSPVLLVVAAIALAALRWRKYYFPAAITLGAVGCVLVCCEGGGSVTFVWGGLYALFALFVRGVYSIPFRKLKLKRRGIDLDALRAPLQSAPLASGIPKITCYEPQRLNVEESGLKLSHARELLAKLKGYPLSAADRLETDVVSRRMELYAQKSLTAEEQNSLNDCLATVLRLTAKYSL